MTAKITDPLEDVIRESGEGWIIDGFHPPEQTLGNLHKVLEQANAEAQKRLRSAAPQITVSAIVAGYKRHPHQITAFFQALGTTHSPDMLVMVWRILQGMEIAEICMDYHRRKSYSLRVRLVSPYGESDEIYESRNIDDAALLRHLGIMKVDNQPLFDGFYALNLKAK